ncbi:MAG: anti-sigma factor [Acidobacteriota bacterium]
MMTHEEFESMAALDAVGAATEEESRALATHLAACAPCQRARDEFGEAAALMVSGIEPVHPPAEVRARLMAQVLEGREMDHEDELLTHSRWRINPWWLATAATLFLALWGWRELSVRAAKEHIQSQQAEIEQLNEANAQLLQQKEKLLAEMSALASADTQTLALTGQQISPAASAKVFLVPAKRRAIVFFANLPRNAKEKSYQLWIIRASDPSKPQSAGVFDANAAGNASLVIDNLPVATEIKGLAVTLEPRGGVAQPTNTDFYLKGTT